MKEPLKHNPGKFHSMVSNEWLEWAEREIESLRARLPKKVEELPTEDGWYWYKGDRMAIQMPVDIWKQKTRTLVYPTWIRAYLTWRKDYFELTKKNFPGTFYGPIQPPEDK